jgi:hypothetical protein
VRAARGIAWRANAMAFMPPCWHGLAGAGATRGGEFSASLLAAREPAPPAAIVGPPSFGRAFPPAQVVGAEGEQTSVVAKTEC